MQNPEYGWAYLKNHPLANYCPMDVEQLHTRVVVVAQDVAGHQDLLRSFVHATGLSIQWGQ